MGYTQIMEEVLCHFFGLYVHLHPVLINLINNGYQIMIHKLNQYMTVLKTITINNTWALK